MIKTSIVIVGGGFGGVACARECARLFRNRPDVDIALVSPRPYHDFQPSLYEVATAMGRTMKVASSATRRGGGNERMKEQSCLRKAVSLPLEGVFQRTKVKIIHGVVRAVDRRMRSVTCTHAPALSYSYLVLALGSVPAFYDIPGLRENSLTLKSIDDALAVRREIQGSWGKWRERVVSGSASSAVPSHKIIIGGGGFTGTELAAELAGTLRMLARSSAKEGKQIPYEIVLISGVTGPVSQLGEEVSRIAKERLISRGVTVITGARIARVERQELEDQAPFHRSKIVVLSDGRRLKGDLVVWTGGVEAAPLHARIFPLTNGTQGRVAVEDTLQAVGEERVFAVGDGAFIVDNDYLKGLPLQAWVAIAEGKHAAVNIYRHVMHTPLLNFRRPRFPFIVPLGGKHAVVKFAGGKVARGILPWVLYQLVELRYYCSLLGMTRGFATWWSEEKICMRGEW